MAAYDFSARRLFVTGDLAPGATVELEREAAHYLLSVLRLGAGATIAVFNGRDGEWLAALEPSGRKGGHLRMTERLRPQPAPPDLRLLFAPLKHARLDYLVQKAVEMGAGTIEPVITRRTVATRVNGERMRANAIEAAEQCGILAVPAIRPERRLAEAVAALEPNRALVFCDEDAPVANPAEALRVVPAGTPAALLIGPEGGFDPAERDLLLARPGTVRLSLGPRILRADTAAVAALAVVGIVIGDWRGTQDPPSLQGQGGGPM